MTSDGCNCMFRLGRYLRKSINYSAFLSVIAIAIYSRLPCGRVFQVQQDPFDNVMHNDLDVHNE